MQDEIPKGYKTKQRSKVIRNTKVAEMSATGMTHTEISTKLDICRQTVSKILSDEETQKKIIGDCRYRMAKLTDRAMTAFEFWVDNHEELPHSANAFKSAHAALKTAGVIIESVDISHQFPETDVITLLNDPDTEIKEIRIENKSETKDNEE